MAKELLTDRDCKNTQPREREYKLGDGGGLNLHILPSGSRVWRFRFRYGAKDQTHVIGNFPEISLRLARNAREEKDGFDGAVRLRELVAAGVHPGRQAREAEEARRAEERDTFEGVAESYFKAHANAWGANHKRDIRRVLDELISRLGSLPMARVARTDVQRALDPIIERGALVYLKDARLYFRCVWKHYNAQRDVPLSDPSATIVIPAASAVKHHAALAFSEAGELLHRLQHSPAMPQTRIAVRLLLMTGLRTTELRAARWSEIDVREKVWRIDGKRMKNGSAHVVPLAPQALALLAQLRAITGDAGPDGLMFPNVSDSTEVCSENTFLHAIYGLGLRGKCTPHGFRSMMAGWATEKGGFSADAIERQLAHAPRDKVRVAYVRTDFMDERRRMMNAWSAYLETSEHDAATRVVAFERAVAIA